MRLSNGSEIGYFAAVFWLLCVCRKVTICQRCGLGRFDQEGIPDVSFPVLMNQNSSPGLALRSPAVSSAGAGPIPCKWSP